MRRLAALLGLLSLACGGSQAIARPFSVEDLLADEAYGSVEIDRGGHTLVFAQLSGLDRLTRFDLATLPVRRSRLMIVDLAHPGPAAPLLDDPTAGTISLGFSPGGTQLAIARLIGDRWQLGIVTIADRHVTWLEVSPAYSPGQPTLAWLDERRLVLLGTLGTTPPWSLGAPAARPARMAARWQAAEAGRTASVTLIGSGRYAALTPHAADQRLLSLDRATGLIRTLATGDLQSLQLAPDSRHVAVLEDQDELVATMAMPATIGAATRRRQLRIIDLRTGADWLPCPACDVIGSPPAWSDDGARLAFVARSGEQDWSQAKLWSVEPARRRVRPLETPGLRPMIDGLPDGAPSAALGWWKHAPVLRVKDLHGTPGWYRLTPRAERLSLPATEGSALVHGPSGPPLLLADSAATSLGRRQPLVTGMTAVIPIGADRPGAVHDRLLAWRSGDQETTITIVGGVRAPTVLHAAPGLQPRAAAPNGPVAAIAADLDGEKRLLLLGRAAEPARVATINRHLADVAPMIGVPITHQLPAGQQLTSWLYLPSTGDRRPPLVVIPYAGTAYGTTAPTGWGPGDGRLYTSIATLVGHGYAVLLPSMPPLPRRSDGPMPLAAQLLSAVDAAVATGRVDGNRLGLWGHSFGGFTAATIATQTHRFRAIVASSGTYDLTSFRGQFAPASRVAPDHGTSIMTLAGWSESGQAALHASPWQDPMRYVVNSPITYADRIQTPMLLVGGDIDTTWIGQAEELFSALARQGKDAELLTYWGGEHVLVSPADVRDLYARVFAWFDMHFKDPGLTAPTARATTITPGKAMLALAPGYPPTRAPNARAAGL